MRASLHLVWDFRRNSSRRRFPFCNLFTARSSKQTLHHCVEINPCVATGDGRLVALDAKVTIQTTTRSIDVRNSRNCAISTKNPLSK